MECRLSCGWTGNKKQVELMKWTQEHGATHDLCSMMLCLFWGAHKKLDSVSELAMPSLTCGRGWRNMLT